MATWDSHYAPLVEVHDPDQDPQKGGLLSRAMAKAFTSTMPLRCIGSYRPVYRERFGCWRTL